MSSLRVIQLNLNHCQAAQDLLARKVYEEELEPYCEHDFVRVKIDNHYIYSCYVTPNMTIPEYCNMLDRLARDAKDRNPKIIAGEFNAWAYYSRFFPAETAPWLISEA